MTHATPKDTPSSESTPPPPRIIAWELTRRCPLNCRHCRAAAVDKPHPGELSTEQAIALLDNIASFAHPLMILTGGEPLLRSDVFDLADHARTLGLPTAIALCGAGLDDDIAARIHHAGIRAVSVSLDGPDAASHDDFRRSLGAFDAALAGIATLRRQNLPVQINSTLTRRNAHQLEALLRLAEAVGAATFNPFLLVPTGRGRELADEALPPEQYESLLHQLKNLRHTTSLVIRVTCAPHYQRILREDPTENQINHSPGGCLGGKSFAFISHTGQVQICGFLETSAGQLAPPAMDFRTIWNTSPFLDQIRRVDDYHGKCGWCEYRTLCGGCRARAYALTGDPFAPEPFCVYHPPRPAGSTH